MTNGSILQFIPSVQSTNLLYSESITQAQPDLLDHDSSLRTSVNRPVTAAAAAIAGLTRCVRPPGPWRPSKFRLLVLADRWPGLELIGVHRQAHAAPGLSPFGAGLQEDAVQSLGLGLMPDRLAARARPAPGRPARSCGRGRRCAAVRRSSIRPLVHEPMNTTSTGISVIGVPGHQPHVLERPASVLGRRQTEHSPGRARRR